MDKRLLFCGMVVVAVLGIALHPAGAVSPDYFKIQVLDRQTGRGVPLVELRTVNNIRYITDSNGIVAFYEPGLMDGEVFFFVQSHGYEFPKDGFGMRGKRLQAVAGGSATIKIDRVNVAERLYRVTGAGIYRDSVLTGHAAPTKEPVLNAQVAGQDSVYTCIYGGRLFWLWGDTSRPAYPLGHFGAAGAFSSLPGSGGLDPGVGVDLEYYIDETGFSRRMCRMKEPGMYWLDGLLTVKDAAGAERMVAHCARMKSLGEAYQRGLVVFDDAGESFKWVVSSGSDYLPYQNLGHAFGVDVEGAAYHYFATQFPLAVRMRVRSDFNDIRNRDRYEVFTSIGSAKEARWVAAGKLMQAESMKWGDLIKALRIEKESTRLYDIESGKEVIPHGGSVYFNAYRNKWVMITVQQFGESSLLGEVWYAEADTPVGPWAYARKIATHEEYSFYNPMHHPYFDQAGGQVIYFEGTYSHMFSGSAETATPRYDYNQIMYRLDLDDKRLHLPVAVYQVEGKYMLRDAVDEAGKWDQVESVPFFAIPPDRPHDGLDAIYQSKGPNRSLTTEGPSPSAKPLFYALGPLEQTGKNSRIVPLFEYRHTSTGGKFYSTDPGLSREGWDRQKTALCRVWKAPPEVFLDRKARPTAIPGKAP